MGTSNTPTRQDAQAHLQALKTERAGYEQAGRTDRVKQVDAEINRWTEIARQAGDATADDATEILVNPAVAEAQNRLRGLEDEKQALTRRGGMEKRIAAVDEQIKHYAGVLRKASGAGTPESPKPAPGRQSR